MSSIQNGKFKCVSCDATFKRSDVYAKHIRQMHQEVPLRPFNYGKDGPGYSCSECNRPFVTSEERDSHLKVHAQIKRFQCCHCGVSLRTEVNRRYHEENCDHGTSASEQTGKGLPTTNLLGNDLVEDSGFEEVPNTFPNVFKRYKLLFGNHSNNLLHRLESAIQDAMKVVRTRQENGNPFKFHLAFSCMFNKPTEPGKYTIPPPVFRTEVLSVYATTETQSWDDILFLNMINQIEQYESVGSGWVWHLSLYLEIQMSLYDPLSASSYIPLPDKLRTRNAKSNKNKRFLLNIHNNDTMCFAYAVLARKYPALEAEDEEHVSHYERYVGELNLSGLQFPMKIMDIGKFEQKNPEFSVSVLGLNESGKIFPLRRHGNINAAILVDMLYIATGNNAHYVLVKNRTAFLRTQITKMTGAVFSCDNCLVFFYTESALKNHQELCLKKKPFRATYPPEGSTFKFTKIEHQVPATFYAVADFEALQVPCEKTELSSEEYATDEVSYTKAKYKHVPYSAAYFIASTDPAFYMPPKLFKGIRCVTDFLESLQKDADYLKGVLSCPLEMHLTEEEEELCQTAEECHICEEKISPDQTYHRDHNHLTGEFRGKSHSYCNTNYRVRSKHFKLVVLMHNFAGYDAHFLLQVADPNKHGRMSCISKTSERFISLTIGNLVFKDSIGFLNNSLEGLVSTLQPAQMKEMRRYIEKLVLDSGKAPFVEFRSPFSFDDTHSSAVAPIPGQKRKASVEKLQVRKRSRIASAFVCDEAEVSSCDGSDDEIDINLETEEDREFVNDDSDDEWEETAAFYHQIENGPKNTNSAESTSSQQSCKNDEIYNTIEDLPINDYRRTPHVHPSIPPHLQMEIDRKFDMVIRKGIFPHENMNSFDQLDETSLPLPGKFYSSLNDEHVSEKEYQHAERVWKEFDMSIMWQYHDLYLMQDVLLLADIIREFREMSLEKMKLEPIHSFTLPGLAFQAMLKRTKVELELISDADILNFIQAGTRGGISTQNIRLANANVPGTSWFNPSEKPSYLIYWDANNQYGWAQSEYLPTHGFTMMTEPEYKDINWQGVPDEAEIGYFLMVKLRYPKELHDRDWEYPLAPESIVINRDMLSEKQISMMDSSWKGMSKLAPNLMDKDRYVCHYRNLKLYLNMGMELVKIYGVVSFFQSPWLRDWVSFCTLLRIDARNKFEEDLCKLYVNSVYGKLIENVEKYNKIDFVTSEAKAKKLANQPTYKRILPISDKLLAVERSKTLVVYNKPIYAGVAVLEISKLLMFDFHYEYVKKKYPGELSKLCFTDTDSFLYHIYTDNIYRDMLEDSVKFDWSNCRKNHEVFSGMTDDEINELKKMNKKKIGIFKDEMDFYPIKQHAGYKPKCYSEEMDPDTASEFYSSKKRRTKKMKGIKKCVVDEKITHQHYVECINESKKMWESMVMFRSKNHVMSTIEQRKLAINCFDDKRYILCDGITTLPHGHYTINESE